MGDKALAGAVSSSQMVESDTCSYSPQTWTRLTLGQCYERFIPARFGA